VRDLIGKIRTKDPNVSTRVYLSEIVRCCECQKTVPLGIEVITLKKDGESKKVLEHRCYCRDHGLEYEEKAQSQPIQFAEQDSDQEIYLDDPWRG
jgi:hypothetical protein